MREALNNNPVVQAAAVAVLLVGAAIFLLLPGGGEEEEAAPAGAVEVAGTEISASGAAPGEAVEAPVEGAAGAPLVPGQLASAAPPPPAPVRAAWESGRTVVLLFVHDDGIDDRLVRNATRAVEGFPNASFFVVPARQISRYAAIAEGVGVERVPALVAVTPKPLQKGQPTASVAYGFQRPDTVRQAVIDAGYEGPTIDYHP
ncbi:MAG TPA: hypothetical protein VJU14_06855 [Solirubrobacterales bacterium]|nr:hypothetical protein [Solirubrobacterales bacterium]